ncbi:replicative DNA helicase [Burkholderia pseudomallei]|uniref:replicative DNA helicase n=1 Tax=Burkholderia pseudomallei TaxID=28450 RepID=UPI0009755AD8|nr:replicative DNA helicase [Burkholderia pseudomallei]OMQ57095.1 replicative DNA helicase [Burkholderia pseudomallei]OMQ65161.1 replicative DNA helicase [Burkholderia pseudomallei]OMQ72892.1 replicative DNA helicase [Burkholderia pseudomallei]CAJ2717107.1 replicative DNA helicase [Burkholderia pseudomallei]VBM94923.1 replicative DNA helicase [Burkholderia pseudomallei]
MNAPHDLPVDHGLAVPPHSNEAEQSVLGALLVNNDAFDRIGDLREEHFYRFDHRTIFEIASMLIVAGKTADIVTVFEIAREHGRADSFGGLAYLNALAQNTPGSAGIARWAEIIVDRWRLRGLASAADRISESAFNTRGRPVSEIIAEAQASLEPLAATRTFEPQLPAPVLLKIIEEIDSRYNGAPLAVTPTGLRDLDEKFGGGMRGGDLVVIAGRPSMGKTAISMTIGGNVAQDTGTVLIFSLEMPAKQLHQRNLARIGGIPLPHILDGRRMTDGDWPRLTHATEVLSNLPMMVDDTSGLTLPEIVSRSRTVKRRHGLSLVIVDYLGLMTGGTDERQDLRIGSYSAGLKGLAKQLDIPVIALAQLNRGVESRPNKRPGMADLRDSGAIEQDADSVLLLYRDEVYNPDSPDRGTAEIIIGKQRNGETGSVRLAFSGEHQRFADLSSGYVPAPRQAPEKSRRGFE